MYLPVVVVVKLHAELEGVWRPGDGVGKVLGVKGIFEQNLRGCSGRWVMEGGVVEERW